MKGQPGDRIILVADQSIYRMSNFPVPSVGDIGIIIPRSSCHESVVYADFQCKRDWPVRDDEYEVVATPIAQFDNTIVFECEEK